MFILFRSKAKKKIAFRNKKFQSPCVSDIFHETTAANLKALRELHDINQDEIAALLGITQTAISKIESGTRSLSDAEKKILDWSFFGTVPPRVTSAHADITKVLDFDEAEWRIIGHIARRQGITEREWIVRRIRDYLAILEESAVIGGNGPQVMPRPAPPVLAATP
jgi:transcriptional regulator with XRE-family HTH domain